MQNLNQVTLIGFLGDDVKIKQISENFTVANFTLATSDTFKDPKSGETKENTQWHNCEAKNGTAELISKFLKKGSFVHIIGKLVYEKFTPQGKSDPVTIAKIQIQDFIALDRKRTE